MNLPESSNRIQIKYHLINSELGTILITPYEDRINEFIRYMRKYNESLDNYSVKSELINTRTLIMDITSEFI